MEENNRISKNLIDFIYLVACGLHQQSIPSEDLADINLATMFKIAENHSLASIIAFALEKSDVKDKEILAKFISKRNNTMKKSILFDNKRAQILAKMDEQGIMYVPLKYVNLVNLYPELGMREFADNDIFYDIKRRKDLVKIFKSLDFEVESVGQSHHDTFLKEPMYNFEMHTELFEKCYPALYKYYKDLTPLIEKDEGNKCGYHFKKENDYVYDIAHAHKHFIHGGNGLRYLVDIYVYNAFAKDLDRSYIDKQLEITETKDFENKSKNIALKLFTTPTKQINLTQDETEMLLYILGSGTYGILKNSIENSMKGKKPSKIKYIFSRLFPGWDWCKKIHPFFYYTFIFIPLLMLGRAFKGLFISRKKAMLELEIVDQIKQEKEKK